MRRIFCAALCAFALAAGCQNVRYDDDKGHFVNDPESYRAPSKGNR
jgi:hypothetical protein